MSLDPGFSLLSSLELGLRLGFCGALDIARQLAKSHPFGLLSDLAAPIWRQTSLLMKLGIKLPWAYFATCAILGGLATILRQNSRFNMNMKTGAWGVFKNFNAETLGINGRQSEIIELALTYGFRGIDLDMDDLVKRCQRSSYENAARFLASAKLKIGSFNCPIDLDADDETFGTKVAQLNGVAEIAGRSEARVAVVAVPGDTDRLPYPEYFEVVRKRIDQIAEIFGKENVRVALSFEPCVPEGHEEKQFKFIRDVEGFLALVKACTAQNVGIVYNSFNWYCGGGTTEQLDALGLGAIATIELADCKEGVEPANATLEDCLLPTSTGVIDNVAFLQRFASTEMKLPVTAVGKPATHCATRDALVSLVEDCLDKSFEGAGLPYTTRKPELFVPEPLYQNS